MKSRRILYLAEPIDQSDYGVWKESVASFERVAVKAGWLVFRPSGAWKLDPAVAPVGPEIEAVNRLVMANAGAIVAHLPKGVPTVGVPREVEWGIANGVPTIVAADNPGWSLHDVHVLELGDTPGFGMWLKMIEAQQSQGATRPIAFLVEDGGTLPTRANDGDAGFDLYTSEDTVIPAGEFVDVPCGIRVALPPGMWARITGRSSTLRKRGLLVAEGIIDTGYRGPLYAGVRNLESEDKVVAKGDRIAQLIPHENVATNHHAHEIDLGLFERIPGDGRGESGFGSSGN